jgi:hypothetical protein
MGVPMRVLALAFSLLNFIATASASETVQFFSGSVQVSSLDGKIPYGPAYPSIIKRVVNVLDGKITECVFENGELILTELDRTESPLIYSAHDATKNSFSGKLVYLDETLTAWSYDLEVETKNDQGKAVTGKVSGSLPELGAIIDSKSGNLTAKKVWNGNVLVSGSYPQVSQATYNKLINELGLRATLPDVCK